MNFLVVCHQASRIQGLAEKTRNAIEKRLHKSNRQSNLSAKLLARSITSTCHGVDVRYQT